MTPATLEDTAVNTYVRLRDMGARDEGAVKAGDCGCTSNPHGAARVLRTRAPGPPFSRVFFAVNASLRVIKTGDGVRETGRRRSRA